LLSEREQLRFLDLGAGIGSTTVPLSDQFPDDFFTGVENAPLTWLTGRLFSLGRPNVDWQWRDLWQTDLSAHDVVYAFLSPVPMPELWKKVEAEMSPGSLFISNTFPVPGVVPTQVIEVDCTPARPLYCYQR
jgi:trans-aconitate methyltransferase